jgi:UDP-3-O-acyl-N-acetylglucosamine deacetylase
LIKLLPLLIDQSRNEDEQIRHLVSESIGRLYIVYSNVMSHDIEKSFRSSNPLERATIARSFKYAGAKDTDTMEL